MTTPTPPSRNPGESSRLPRTFATARPPAPVTGAPVMLRAAKAVTIAIRGPRSGRTYVFTDRNATSVLAEDAPALLRSGAVVRG